jgi:hypothetical protein
MDQCDRLGVERGKRDVSPGQGVMYAAGVD